MNKPAFFISFVVVLFSLLSEAALLPQNLNAADRKKAVDLLGFGTMTTPSWSPRPLGGYQGTELFVSQDIFSAKDLSNLGNRQSGASGQQVTSFGLGQGLYYDVDIFMHFTPMPQRDLMNVYGGLIRKAFLKDITGRFQLAASLSASVAQYENLASFTNTAQDVMMSFIGTIVDFTVGVGQARSIGQFIGGGSYGITDTGSTEEQDSNNSHLFASTTYYHGNMNFTATWDRFESSKMSLKLGYRF